MPSFSKKSAERLAQCHPDLQAVMNEAIKGFDFSVLCGHRGKDEQDQAVERGASKTPWPKSKHNAIPSLAVDIAPYPCDWEALNAPRQLKERYKAAMEKFVALAKHIHTTAYSLGIVLRHGADWNMNGDYDDENFIDWPHWEVVNVV